MVGPSGNVKGDAMKAPPPPGQQHPMKATTAAATAAATMGDISTGKYRQARMSPAGETSSKVLQQSRKTPFGPAAMVAGGLAVVATIAFFQINTTNKMEETSAIKEAGKTNSRT